MAELVTFGETMAAFTPVGAGALRYVSDYRLRIAGAESNVAIGVQKLGRETRWISRLGDDEFGHYVRNAIRGEGVDTSGVRFDPEYRTGAMFKQTGAGETTVYYYRENSAASHLCPGDLEPGWLKDARLLHLTGITPALSESCRRTVTEAFVQAENAGVAVSFDPNIRKKLWKGADYRPLLKDLTLRADIVLLGLDEAETLFGLCDPDQIFTFLFQEGRAERVAIKNGAKGAWAADRGTRIRLEPFPCRCVEPIGAGDAFDAGFLAGFLEGRGIAECGRMGAVAGALATQTPGDIEGYPTRRQMEAIIKGETEPCR